MKWEIRQKVDLQVMTPQRATPECLFMVGNAQAHRWKVEVYSGGTPVDIDGRLVVAMVQRPDGLVAMLKGIAKSNVAEVVLDSAYINACFGKLRAFSRPPFGFSEPAL